MNKLGIFMNFWEKGWAADHKKYIKKAAELGFDILEFQAQPLLEMTDDHIRDLRKLADEGVENAAKAVECMLEEGIQTAMNKYNILKRVQQ